MSIAPYQITILFQSNSQKKVTDLTQKIDTENRIMVAFDPTNTEVTVN